MKKLFFISTFFITIFLFQKNADAQLVSLDSIRGIPDTVIDNQLVSFIVYFSNSGGAIFSGDLTLFLHSDNDTSPPDTIFHLDTLTISGNTLIDSTEGFFTFTAAELDAGDNIVVVWPSSASASQYVQNDSLVFHVFLKNVGIPEIEQRQSLFVYPNPSHAEVQLRFGFPEKVEQVRVLDILGKEELSYGGAVKRFNVENLDDGIYFVEVKNHDGSVVVKKFFKD